MSASVVYLDPYINKLSKDLNKEIKEFHSFKFIEEFDQVFCFEFRFDGVNTKNFHSIAIKTNLGIDNFNEREDEDVEIIKSKGRLGSKLYVRMFIRLKCKHKKGE